MWPPCRERVLITVIVLGAVVAGHLLPLPGVHIPGHLWLTRFHPFALGIRPYLIAAVLWLLLSGAIDRLGRMRDGSRDERASFDQVIVVIALVIGLAQSAGIQQEVSSWTSPGRGERALLVPTLVGGLALLVATAMVLTRFGVGNGVAWIWLVTAHLAMLTRSIRREMERLETTEFGFFHVPVALLALAGLVVASIYYLQARKDLTLEPIEPRKVPAPGPTPTLPLRFNLVGVVPFMVAHSAIMSLLLITSLFGLWLTWIAPDSVGYWVLQVVLVFFLSYVVAGIAFDTRRVGPLLERFGYRIAGLPPGQSSEQYLDRLIERRVPLSAAALIGMLLVPKALEAKTGISLDHAGLGAMTVLLASALVLDTVRHARGLRDIEGGRWVEAFEADTELEARLVVARLADHEIRGVLLANRVIPITGTLAFWEWTAPTYANLVVHRRLGGGRVIVQVQLRDAVRAHEILDPLRPEAATLPRTA